MKLLMICAALIVSLVAYADEAATIQVKSVAEVEGANPEITLADIIVAHGVSPKALETLREVRLADMPKAGESRSFTALGIEQVFRPHLREIEQERGESITLRVPTRVTVVRKSFRLTPKEVEQAMLTQMRELCADCIFEINELRLPAIPTSVTAGSKWQVRMRSDLPKGAFSIPLEVINEDSSKRTYWLSGQLNVRKRVPVASRTFETGERLRAEDFNYQIKDVTFATDFAPSEAELGASVTARQIQAGQIVWRSQLKRELAVKVGDVVKVSAGAEGWQIMIDGISQSSGYIGDLVKVKIPRTQKMVSGLLSERGLVEVH